MFCTPLKHHIISSPVFASQRNFFYDNSCTYLYTIFFIKKLFSSSAFLCSSTNFLFFFVLPFSSSSIFFRSSPLSGFGLVESVDCGLERWSNKESCDWGCVCGRGGCHWSPQMVLLCKVTFRERVELTDVNVLPFLAECRLRCHRFSYLYQQVLSVPQI